MSEMGTVPAHAKPVAKHDHLWVLGVIAVAVLAEVWASWVGIGAMSGFPRIDGVPTDWVLAVAVEAYWGYALYAWLAAAPGPRSRAMAMWSCAVVFVLSLVSQVSYHELMAPAGVTTGRRFVIGFASALPVIILALIAVLIHLRHLDRAEAAEADERTAVQAEMDALRSELAAGRDALALLRDTLTAAESERDEANAKTESLAAKLAARKPNRTRTKAPNAGRRKDPNAAPNGKPNAAPNAAPDMEVPNDFDARAEALEIYLGNPGISGKELGAKVGLGERWGQLRKTEFRNAVNGAERSDEHS